MRPTSWIQNAIIYQVYPQSFQDSNGDGIGDFPGLIRRLDYIQSLGVTALWLNPCFDSPFGDAGYDVRDFYTIAPRYGSEADFERLAREAHARGMKVILDLVAGHTSMDNAWFAQEAKDPHAPDANRYIWKNRNFDPAQGPAREDFVSNFFWYQPALNFGYSEPSEPWQDPIDAPGPQKNRAELRQIMAYWFDRGCDGFRVDMAGSLVKPEGTPASLAATQELWQELRTWLETHYPDRALIAEWSYPTRAIQAGFDLDFMMHFNAPGYHELFFNGVGAIPPKSLPCYFDAQGKGSLEVFRNEYRKQLEGTRGLGYVSLPVANHDFQRLRCGVRGWEGLRCAWVFFMTQAGPPTIYYGEEIGMRYVEDSPAKEGSTLIGITAVNAGTDYGERAGTRTPMQWDDSPNAGFSTANPEALYLPLDSDPERPTVSAQEASPDSLLHFVRALVAIRRAHPALASDASFAFLNPVEEQYPMLYLREAEGERLLVAINPADTARTIRLPLAGQPGDALVDSGCTWSADADSLTVTVPAFGYGIISLV